MDDDISFHHFSLTFNPKEVGTRLKEVRFLLVAGCAFRVEAQANYLADHLFNGILLSQRRVERLTKPHSRFALFKIGPVLLSNHGIGSASMSIAMHELFLMCRLAQSIEHLTVIRFGTCGGLGVEPGTVCITNRALDPMFQDYVELKICMKLVRRPCTIDLATANLLAQLGKADPNHKQLGDYDIRMGATVASNDFYEEQGRTIGAICEHSIEDKMQFLERARQLGVINMEMECNYLAAMCHKLNVPFGVVCVALTNRLVDDRIRLDHNDISQCERRLFWINLLFIKHKLQPLVR